MPTQEVEFLLLADGQIAGFAESKDQAVKKAGDQSINGNDYVNVYQRVATVRPKRIFEVDWADNMGDC